MIFIESRRVCDDNTIKVSDVSVKSNPKRITSVRIHQRSCLLEVISEAKDCLASVKKC